MKHNNEDTTKLIWDYYFKVSMPFLQTSSEDYLRIHGIPLSGDHTIDNQVATSWITTMANIATMVDHYKNGVMIKVCSEADTKTIYDYISRHLEAWKFNLQHAVNIGDAPIDDLIAMDQFANEVYEFAKYHFTPDTLTSIFGRNMGNLLGFTPGSFFKPNTLTSNHLPSERTAQSTGIIAASVEDPNTPPDRESMASFLKASMGTLKRWR